MENRARLKNKMNHNRQLLYLEKGIIMLPTKREEIKAILKKNGVEAT